MHVWKCVIIQWTVFYFNNSGNNLCISVIPNTVLARHANIKQPLCSFAMLRHLSRCYLKRGNPARNYHWLHKLVLAIQFLSSILTQPRKVHFIKLTIMGYNFRFKNCKGPVINKIHWLCWHVDWVRYVTLTTPTHPHHFQLSNEFVSTLTRL